MSQMPSKIWLHKDTKYSTGDIVCGYQYDFVQGIEDEGGIENFVKYVPADAFIEKAEDLEKAAVEAFKQIVDDERNSFLEIFKAGAKWAKAHNWKPADGDDLPEIDREVIALLDNGKVVFAHRPPEYWDGKDIVTGKVTRNYPKTYDKGGWNIPDIKYWLDVELPKEIEL